MSGQELALSRELTVEQEPALGRWLVRGQELALRRELALGQELALRRELAREQELALRRELTVELVPLLVRGWLLLLSMLREPGSPCQLAERTIVPTAQAARSIARRSERAPPCPPGNCRP